MQTASVVVESTPPLKRTMADGIRARGISARELQVRVVVIFVLPHADSQEILSGNLGDLHLRLLYTSARGNDDREILLHHFSALAELEIGAFGAVHDIDRVHTGFNRFAGKIGSHRDTVCFSRSSVQKSGNQSEYKKGK